MTGKKSGSSFGKGKDVVFSCNEKKNNYFKKTSSLKFTENDFDNFHSDENCSKYDSSYNNIDCMYDNYSDKSNFNFS